ncbi:MAG: MerR family DNA-binding transcriptional regulator [Acidimicrobiia bacterium]|nr:MerR family DNA-binding transcriptional regulator [Acidimicrobiia bacterium]
MRPIDRDDDGELMSIGQLAAATNVSSRTIRYYEELGILPEPPRSPGGTRRYPKEYRFYVEGALALKELGFSLDEIKLLGRLALGRPMSARQRDHTAEIVREKMRMLEHRINVLTRLREILHEQEEGSGEPGVERLSRLLDIGWLDAEAGAAS